MVKNLEDFGLANELTREVVPFLRCQVHLEGYTYRNKDRLHHRKFWICSICWKSSELLTLEAWTQEKGAFNNMVFGVLNKIAATQKAGNNT